MLLKLNNIHKLIIREKMPINRVIGIIVRDNKAYLKQ